MISTVSQAFKDKLNNGEVPSIRMQFIPATGYADETSIHYEIKDGVIVKEISNAGGWGGQAEDKKPLCQNCPYGVELKTDIVDSEIRATIEKLMSKYD